eukprot:CAMPEP_0178390562 /NCGR_PEP_ID=MMETSP0689_2-20121128/10711_1 /TAXON_ID=160604 /ORGANISM="Amphidinium massartii, Strain CS-259" /LENGTH=358 /DNA_ID=CAMNT_0020011077 /DNA_START=64 /DNA_END=1140 /DNA_ORIENTATION=+
MATISTPALELAAQIEDRAAQVERADEGQLVNPDDGLNEDFRDTFDTKGVAGVLMMGWDKQEAEAYANIGNVRQLPQLEKRKVFCFYQRVFAELNLGDGTWHDAVWMLYRSLAAEPSLELCPSTCMSVVMLLQKNVTATKPLVLEWYVDRARQLHALLAPEDAASENTAVPNVEARDILDKEREVLQALRWKVNAPSVHTWLHVLSTRMHYLWRCTYGAQVGYAFQKGIVLANGLLMWMDVPIAPRQLANSLFCIGLVFSGMLPMSAISGGEFKAFANFSTEEDFTQLLARAWGESAPSPCKVPEEHFPRLMGMLEAGTGRTMQQLQEDIRAVTPAIAECIYENDRRNPTRLAAAGGA